MSAIVELFKVNPRTYELEINKEDIIGVIGMEHFQRIIKTSMKVEGDYDGTKKLMNHRILMFVKFMSYSKVHILLNETDKFIKASEDAGLPENWHKTYPQYYEMAQDAIKKYIEVIDTYIPSIKLLRSLQAGFGITSKVVDRFVAQINSILELQDEAIENFRKNENTSTDDFNSLMQSMQSQNTLMMSSIQDLLDVSKKLPSSIKELKQIEEAIKTEEGAARELAGGRRKGRREDPK